MAAEQKVAVVHQVAEMAAEAEDLEIIQMLLTVTLIRVPVAVELADLMIELELQVEKV